MSEFYDRQGHPIADLLTWGRMMGDLQYKRVAETTLLDGKWISTVWLGMDHGFGDGPPLIFETMVFDAGDTTDLDQERYSTEADALAGHERMVEKWAHQIQENANATQ